MDRIKTKLKVLLIKACLYMLYEYINGGELWKFCKVYGLPSIKLIKYYFKQIIEAVMHIHSFDLVHRDLKVIDRYKNSQRIFL